MGLLEEDSDDVLFITHCKAFLKYLEQHLSFAYDGKRLKSFITSISPFPTFLFSCPEQKKGG